MAQLDRSSLLARYADAPRRLEEEVRALPVAALAFRPNPDDWTATELVIHLADNEMVDSIRVRMAIAESGVTIQRYDEARWARELDYANDDVEDALLAFRVARLRTHRLLGRLSDAAWERVYSLPEGGERSLADKLRGDVEHDDLHLRQLMELRELVLIATP